MALESVGGPAARLARGALDRLAELAPAAGGEPVLIVVGEVAGPAECADLRPLERRIPARRTG